MAKGHDFNFDGGEILSKMGATWFVSFAYFNYIDKNHLAWKNLKYSEQSVQSRTNNYNKSKKYHLTWLYEVMKMQQLDSHVNKCNLNSIQTKEMAEQIICKIIQK